MSVNERKRLAKKRTVVTDRMIRGPTVHVRDRSTY